MKNIKIPRKTVDIVNEILLFADNVEMNKKIPMKHPR